MNQNINLGDWYSVIQDALYWKHIDPDEAILYFSYANRALADGCRYYTQDYTGQHSIDLTLILEQFILLAKLKANYD